MQKTNDTIKVRSIENNSKSIKARVRRGVPFSLKTEFFSVRDSSIVTLNLNIFYESQYI